MYNNRCYELLLNTLDMKGHYTGKNYILKLLEKIVNKFSGFPYIFLTQKSPKYDLSGSNAIGVF